MRVIGLAVLSLSVGAPVAADQCMNSVDNMIVAYNLPASRTAAVSDQASAHATSMPSRDTTMQQREEPMTGERSSGGTTMQQREESMTGERSSGGYQQAPPHSQPRPIEVQRDNLYRPEVQSVPQLSKRQRERLQDLLYQASDAEAEGDNARCMQLLQQAEAIAKERPAPQPRERRR